MDKQFQALAERLVLILVFMSYYHRGRIKDDGTLFFTHHILPKIRDTAHQFMKLLVRMQCFILLDPMSKTKFVWNTDITTEGMIESVEHDIPEFLCWIQTNVNDLYVEAVRHIHRLNLSKEGMLILVQSWRAILSGWNTALREVPDSNTEEKAYQKNKIDNFVAGIIETDMFTESVSLTNRLLPN